MPQNKSAFSDSFSVRAVPFAVTIVAYITRQKYTNAVRRGERTYLEKVVDDETMLTSQKTETSTKEEALNAMSHRSHPCKLRGVPSYPCLQFMVVSNRIE